MSTIVYHHQQGNLQSCFEMTATMKLKVPPPPPPCWSFDLKDTAAEKETAAYVHPLARRPSSSRLSEQSLALCTEPLGSETGTDMTAESSIIFSSAAANAPGRQVESRNNISAAVKNIRNSRNNNNFPPPLTTITGANSLRVRPHREGGRLVITAVETPSKRSYLQAERSNGRLRLCYFFNDSDHFDPRITTNQENEEFKDESNECEGDINGDDEVAEVEEVEEEEEEEEGGEEESDVYMARDMDGNTFDVEVEMGTKKCLLGRCKEGGHSNNGFCHWGEPPMWVTT